MVSTSIPRSRARAATSVSSDDLPMPASPRTTIALPFDPARSIRSSMTAISRSRPYRRVAEFPWTTRLQVYVAKHGSKPAPGLTRVPAEVSSSSLLSAN